MFLSVPFTPFFWTCLRCLCPAPDCGRLLGRDARQRLGPRSVRRRIKETLAIRETLTAALGRTPTVDEIANALGVDRAEAGAALEDAARTVSTLDDVTGEFLVSETESPEGAVLTSERLAFLRAAVATLPEKMRYVVEQIYFEDRSVKDLAEELGATHSAVSQQRAEAIRLLGDGLATHYADDDDVTYVPQSRISPTRRTAYLSTLGTIRWVGSFGVLIGTRRLWMLRFPDCLANSG